MEPESRRYRCKELTCEGSSRQILSRKVEKNLVRLVLRGYHILSASVMGVNELVDDRSNIVYIVLEIVYNPQHVTHGRC